MPPAEPAGLPQGDGAAILAVGPMTTPGERIFRNARAFIPILTAALLCAAATGCGPSNPLDETVSAKDELGLTMWRNDASHDLSPEQAADFDRALQEIRFHIMAGGTVHGSRDIEDAALQMVNGQTLRHVLQQGLGWELERAEAERSRLEADMKANAQMRTRPDDTDSKDYLTDLRSRQVTRLKAATDEVNHARERLAATGAPVAPAPSPAPDR
jgi:hypothetical protein